MGPLPDIYPPPTPEEFFANQKAKRKRQKQRIIGIFVLILFSALIYFATK